MSGSASEGRILMTQPEPCTEHFPAAGLATGQTGGGLGFPGFFFDLGDLGCSGLVTTGGFSDTVETGGSTVVVTGG